MIMIVALCYALGLCCLVLWNIAIALIHGMAFFPLIKNLQTKKTRKGSSFGWLIRQMSINQKSGRKTFRRRFVSGSIFVSPCPPECYFQSETKIEPGLRLIYPQNLLVYFIWHCRVCRFLTASFPGSSLFLLSIYLVRCYDVVPCNQE